MGRDELGTSVDTGVPMNQLMILALSGSVGETFGFAVSAVPVEVPVSGTVRLSTMLAANVQNREKTIKNIPRVIVYDVFLVGVTL